LPKLDTEVVELRFNVWAATSRIAIEFRTYSPGQISSPAFAVVTDCNTCVSRYPDPLATLFCRLASSPTAEFLVVEKLLRAVHLSANKGFIGVIAAPFIPIPMTIESMVLMLKRASSCTSIVTFFESPDVTNFIPVIVGIWLSRFTGAGAGRGTMDVAVCVSEALEIGE
jgi:hypothetical protein